MDEQIKFEMIRKLNEAGYGVVEGWKYQEFRKNYKFFVETDEGREILRNNHFISRKEIKGKMSQAFNKDFQCTGCQYYKNNESICVPCRKLQNIIKTV